jgi:hypothetical protein
MTVRVDVEEIETTKGEKLLAGVLTVFTLIGLLWIYFNIDVERDHDYRSPAASLSASDRAALGRYNHAVGELRQARRREERARIQLVDRREAYRTALDQGRDDPSLERSYEAAQAAYSDAQARRRAAGMARAAAAPASRAAQRQLAAAREREQDRVDGAQRHDDRVSVARRLGLLLFALGLSYFLLGRLRRRRSRYLPAGMAAVAAVALLAVAMAVDYLGDYVEITDVGVLLLSIAGGVMTLAAFAALQRYLARRIPERRVRRRECPFCGYPVRDHKHCEGCGRDVIAECATCRTPRRVGTRHCGTCGAS